MKVGRLGGFGALILFFTSIPSASAQHRYGEALQKSLYFYEAQQSGELSSGNRVAWRGDSHLEDSITLGGKRIDLSGGWYDAGDHWKSNTTMAYAASMLSWTAIQYPTAYTATGQMDELLESIEHVNRYFLKCIIDSFPQDPERFDSFELIVDVGGNPGPQPSVHSVWTSPEAAANLTVREALRVNTEIRGPDVAAAMSAAMASSALLLREHGTASQKALAQLLYTSSAKLLRYSEQYPFDDESLVNGSPLAIAPDGRVRVIHYRSNIATDEQLFATLWMHRARKAFEPNNPSDTFLRQFQSKLYALEASGKPHWDTFGWWRDLFAGQYNHAVLLLALQTLESKVERDRLEEYLFSHLDHWNSLPPSPKGLKVRDVYQGSFSLKFSLNQAYLAAMYADYTENSQRRDSIWNYAKSQVDYALGDNEPNVSFMVGYGSKGWPARVHHRGAHGWWGGFESITASHEYFRDKNRHTIYGALMAGPRRDGSFSDDWNMSNHHFTTEVALDFNAGIQGVLAAIVARNPEQHPPLPDSSFPPPPVLNQALDWKVTDRQYFVVAKLLNQTADALRVEAWLHNQSSYPPVSRTKMSFRLYLPPFTRLGARVATVEEGQGATVSEVRGDERNPYVEVAFPTQRLAPTRVYNVKSRPGMAEQHDDLFRRKAIISLSSLGGARDSGWSLKTITSAATIISKVPVYDGGVLLEGEEPAVGQTSTATPTPSRTSTPTMAIPTATPTVTPTATPRVPTATPTSAPTATPRVVTPTPTATPTATSSMGQRTPTPLPTPRRTPSPESTSLRIDVGGAGGKVGDKQWIAGKVRGVSFTGQKRWFTSNRLSPRPSAGLRSIVSSYVRGSKEVKGTVRGLSKGTYNVYLYMLNVLGGKRDIQVTLTGGQKKSVAIDGARGAWKVVGPFSATLAEREDLTLSLQGEEVSLSAVEVVRTAR